MSVFARIQDLTSGQGFGIALITLALGFVFSTIFPKAPFTAFASGVVGVFGAMTTQRYFKNKLEMRNGCGKDLTDAR